MLLTKPDLLPARRAAACALLLPVVFVLSGCGTAYLAQAAGGQLKVMNAREPIDAVVASPGTSEELRTQLLRAQRIREFASKELGLPDNAAYRSYADIGRPYVVWNVVATPEFSVAPREWCFPVVGCVSYRGYFSQEQARAFAARLAGEGDDTLVGGVPAYSTLGRIADPLLSTVSRYAEIDLAALIFHELAHQVLYVPGDSGFNEAFATAVEEEGVARYVAAYLDPAALVAWQKRRSQRREAVGLLVAAREDLVRLYAASQSEQQMRAAKAQRFAQLAADLEALQVRHGATWYGSWLREGLNNAHLASVATYYGKVPAFEQLLHERCGGYLPCFYVEARRQSVESGYPASR